MKNAFTLAEVLITLAIIGVIAAMTIPTLLTSTRGKEYETGAKKAMSTLANSLQMRYAMDGQTLADYRCVQCAGSFGPNVKIAEYLTKLPAGSRVGDQPALQTYAEGARDIIIDPGASGAADWYNGLYPMPSTKLKDGMIMTLGIFSAGIPNSAEVFRRFHYVVFDTNGEKGPSRFNLDTSYNGNVCAATDTRIAISFTDSKTGAKVPSTGCIDEDQNKEPTNNENPDIVMFRVNPHTGSVEPVGRRTRNILATGNAMIAQ